MPIESHPCPVRRLTSGPKAHFFGYYDKSPWDLSGTRLLALEAEEHGRMPLAGEEATVVLIEAQSGQIHPLATTRAWNWQQGCMAQWLRSAADREVLYNDQRDGQLVAVRMDIHTGRERVLPRPIYDVAPDGRFALSVNFARLAAERPIVGYAAARDPFAEQLAPEGDGVWRLDLETGAAALVFSLAQATQLRPLPSMANEMQRFEHITIAPDGRRFFGLQRWPRREKGRPFHDRMFTVGCEGADPYILADEDFVSHFSWRDPEHVLAWAQHGGERHFFVYRDQHPEVTAVGPGVLTSDAHCSYSPNRRWVLGDAYPDAEWKMAVWLYELARDRRITVAHFQTRRELYQTPGIRCDLHPRWSRDGRQVCVDAPHEDARQLFILDVAGVVG